MRTAATRQTGGAFIRIAWPVPYADSLPVMNGHSMRPADLVVCVVIIFGPSISRPSVILGLDLKSE